MSGHLRYAEITELPNYRFSDDGGVQSRWIRGSKNARVGETWHEVRPRQNSRSPYLYVTLKTPGGRKHFRVNVLILWAFTGYRPSGLEAAHLDGNSLNNRRDNLDWQTHARNLADKNGHGTILKGTQIVSSVLDDETAETIQLLLGATSYAELGRMFGVSEATIRKIARGETWNHTARAKR